MGAQDDHTLCRLGPERVPVRPRASSSKQQRQLPPTRSRSPRQTQLPPKTPDSQTRWKRCLPQGRGGTRCSRDAGPQPARMPTAGNHGKGALTASVPSFHHPQHSSAQAARQALLQGGLDSGWPVASANMFSASSSDCKVPLCPHQRPQQRGLYSHFFLHNMSVVPVPPSWHRPQD